MPAPVLFLESASGHKQTVHVSVAIETVKHLIQTLRRIRRVNTQISLNSGIRLPDYELAPGQTLQALLAGAMYRDEWTFLRDLAAKSPLSSGFETWLSKAELSEVKTAEGAPSEALTWANLLDTGVVSFHVLPEWQEPWISANCLVLNENGEFSSHTKEIPNSSTPEHVEHHHDWLKALGFDQLPLAEQLWNEKESRFPGLRFLDRVKNQISDLATSGAPYKQALGSLDLLSNDAVAWNGKGAPKFSARVANGEHDGRRILSVYKDELTKSEYEFDRHAYFTGGFAGRIHFRLAADEQKFVVAHVGFKL